jgi:uncharacterized membrane protein SirB2
MIASLGWYFAPITRDMPARLQSMDSYQIIKNVHVSCAGLSIAVFVLRSAWVLRGSPSAHHRLTRVVPHFIDATLLLSALGLLYLSGYRPSGSDWLTFKLMGVILYIAFGMIALDAGRTMGQRAITVAAALMVFAYIVAVSLTGQRWPFA